MICIKLFQKYFILVEDHEEDPDEYLGVMRYLKELRDSVNGQFPYV